MTITELKQKYPEYIISQVATEIVLRGLSELRIVQPVSKTEELINGCLDAIKTSDWNDIRSIIKRTL